MIGLGTIINVGAIIVGGILGLFFGKFIKERIKDMLTKTCGLATLFLGIGGALEGMLSVENGIITSGKAVIIVVSLALGGLIGEIINIEYGLEKFGDWLKEKTKSESDNKFTEGFLTASFTVSIGAMAIIGAFEDAINNDYSILITKSILDFIIVMILSGTMGKGCIFSAIPVAIIQGLFTALAFLIQPYLTALALSYLSMVGSILIFGIGINLVWGKTIKVANLIPSLIIVVIAAYLPI